MKNGQQLQSVVCSTKLVVIRKPTDEDAALCCGGLEMVDTASAPADKREPADSGLMTGSQMGKRYSEPTSGVQVLCVSGGEGTLTIDGLKLEIEASKKLPSSD